MHERDALLATASAGAPELGAGGWCWSGSTGDAEIRFLGVGAPPRETVAGSFWSPRTEGAAWLRQVHSATVCEASPGACGEGDALISAQRNLALVVVTADCVPVILVSDREVAAVHAGWRGIVAGVVPAAVARFRGAAPNAAWIGPAIGPCCYEVGDEVAASVVASSGPDVLRPGRRDRPHLDLQAAVERQLSAAGVRRCHRIARCTACHPQWLHSYRRDGARAGRNLALVWRRREGDSGGTTGARGAGEGA